MNDRAQAVILELAGRCPTCGTVRCAAPRCLRARLAYHDAPPVLSRYAAERLIARLTSGPGRLSRHDAEQIVRRDYHVIG